MNSGDAMKKLGNDTLSSLPEGIERPRYDRGSLTPGIVHIGLGNFHRAHQAWYLHRLMQVGRALDWAIIGAGVRPYDAEMRERLLAQDCLTTLIELDPSGASAEVIGPMVDYVPVEGGNRALIRAMADPQVRVVSLTVTEGGYYTGASGRFDATHADIAHDAQDPDNPRTAFGAMTAALKLRRAAGHGPFTGQSCDNLQGNGAILRQTVVSLARLSDPGLADWIDCNCSFPNSMVGLHRASDGHQGNCPCAIVQDRRCRARHSRELPSVGDRGRFLRRAAGLGTKSVPPSPTRCTTTKTMKIRILNAGHQVLSNAGELLSVETIADCMEHPLIAALFRKVQAEEIAPYVHPVPDMTPENYKKLVERRFSNPEIVDTTRRVAFDGSSRHARFVLPILREALAAGGSVEGLSLVEALWARMCDGTREDGSRIESNDPFWDDLTAYAARAREVPHTWLEMRENLREPL